MRGIAILLAAMMWASASAAEDVESGNFFFNAFCTNPDDPDIGVIAYSDGFIAGALVGTVYASKDNRVLPYCRPHGVSNQQYGRVICHYLKDHPAETNQTMAVLILKAFTAVWPAPCKKP
jgi:Rap1a immunity proteins